MSDNEETQHDGEIPEPHQSASNAGGASNLGQSAIQQLAQALLRLVGDGDRNTAHSDQPKKRIEWRLIQVLCPRKLDSESLSSSEQKSWERGFRAFIKDSQLEEFEWEEKLMALETGMEP